MNELIAVLNHISTYQGIFLSLILFNRKKNKFSNNILSLILFSSSIAPLTINLYLKGLMIPVYFLTYIIFPLLFLYSPLIYLYTLSMIGEISRFDKKHLLHFIPSVLSFIIFLYINMSYHYYTRFQLEDINISYNFSYQNTIIFIYSTLVPISGIIYTVLSWRIMSLYTLEIGEYFSNIAELRVLWLKFFLGMLFVIFLNSNIMTWIKILNITNSSFSNSFFLLNFCFIVITAFFLLRKPDIFKYTHEMLAKFSKDKENITDLLHKQTKAKYEKTDIDENKKEEYLLLLQNFMKEKKPYLEENITLKDLADELSIPPYHLSIVINERLKQNFYNFINSYRINDVIEKLADRENIDTNVLNLAYESGFNSKSTFNTAFKNITGMTPTEYKRSRSQDRSELSA